ncbi:MAG: hypothetical protein V7727_08460, partial [Sneathiella sp.]
MFIKNGLALNTKSSAARQLFSSLSMLAMIFITALVLSSAASAIEIPKILDDKDAGLYQKIFNLQEKADWRGADKLIKKVSNPLLLGHVKYQRYMHPNKYRAQYSELHL